MYYRRQSRELKRRHSLNGCAISIYLVQYVQSPVKTGYEFEGDPPRVLAAIGESDSDVGKILVDIPAVEGRDPSKIYYAIRPILREKGAEFGLSADNIRVWTRRLTRAARRDRWHDWVPGFS